MEKYPISIAESRIVAIMNGQRVLVSTGAAVSIGEMSEIKILGQVHKLENKLRGADINSIRSSLKADISAILGMDILAKFVFYVSHGIQAIICSDYFINFKENMRELPIRIDQGLPVMEVKIAGVEMNMVLDTGSRFSYLREDMLRGVKNVDIKETFYPGAGGFITDIYDLPLDIKGKDLSVPAGVLPEALKEELAARDCVGILGADIFRYFNIQFNFRNSTIWLVEKGTAR